jgi:23S rRNA (guanosine2251-2'-O)-methyltransferase
VFCIDSVGARMSKPSGSKGRSKGAKPGRARGAAPRSSSSRGSSPRSAGGPRRDARGSSRGAAPRGAARREGAPDKKKSLGGDQVEGRQAVRELLIAQKRKVREIWISNEIDNSDIVEDIVQLATASRVQIMDVPRRIIEDTARSEAPQGVIAFAQPLQEHSLDELTSTEGGRKPFLVAVDGVTDPGNFGALLRCCDGAGVTGVVVPRHRAVHVTPTVAKAAAGAAEHIPMAVVQGLPAAMGDMKKAGVWLVGLDDEADASLFDMGSLAAEPICVVLGAEGAGLSRLVRERCDMVVSIPMLGQLSSLNVSAAGALATYEVARVRRNSK